MEGVIFEVFDADQITDDMLQAAAKLFSVHYGLWSQEAAQSLGTIAQKDRHVRMNKEWLRAQLLSAAEHSSYARAIVDGHLVANAFCCRWLYDDQVICWITQLVVHRDYRERGLATKLLRQLKQDDDDFYGLLSSHPAACLAAATAFSNSIKAIDLELIRDHAKGIVRSSPIRYIRNARLRGSLFGSEDHPGIVSCGDTKFFVDHTEPLKALSRIRGRADGYWPLGDLADGYEFLLVVEGNRPYRQSASNVAATQLPDTAVQVDNAQGAPVRSEIKSGHPSRRERLKDRFRSIATHFHHGGHGSSGSIASDSRVADRATATSAVAATSVSGPAPDMRPSGSEREYQLDLRNTALTTVEERVAPAVKQEVVKKQVEYVQQEHIQREIHSHEVRHRIQPIIDVEVLPARHFVPGPDGHLTEVAESQIPGRVKDGGRNWVIKETIPRTSADAAVATAQAAGVDGTIASVKKYVSPDGVEHTETVWVHPPTIEDGGRLTGQTIPVRLKKPVETARKEPHVGRSG